MTDTDEKPSRIIIDLLDTINEDLAEVEVHMEAMTVLMTAYEKRLQALEEMVKTLSNRD